MIDAGADVNAQVDLPGHIGVAPLHLAANTANNEVIELLLARGADANLEGGRDCGAPLLWADNEHIVGLLIAHGADVNASHCFTYRDYFGGCGMGGFTLAHLNAFFGRTGVLKLLIESGARINEGDFGERTPLHYAGMQGHVQAAELLLLGGAEVEAKDAEGWTALAWAVKEGHRDVAAVLLANGADARWCWEGGTLLDESIVWGRGDLISLLASFGAGEYPAVDG
jgi:ankyrin repeat protein